MKFAISTCWNSHRHTDGYDMLKELADLGFEYAELSHGIRISLVPGILRALDEHLIKISSVHNFCPLPPGVMGAAPNLYQPTSASGNERELWFRNTLKTIDFAQRVDADLMVIHSGSTAFFLRKPWRKIEEAREKVLEAKDDAAREQAEKEFMRIRDRESKRIRRRQLKGARKRCLESYRAIIPFLQEKGVRAGIENRESLLEFPHEQDMPDLLTELDNPELFGYWHDAGHAALKERLGVMPHRQLLEQGKERLFGFHLHDVSAEDRDHQCPGTGVINWDEVQTFFDPKHIFVLELSPRLRTEEVQAAKEFIEPRLPKQD